MEDIESVRETMDGMSSAEINFSADEALPRYMYEASSSAEMQAVCENKFLRDPLPLQKMNLDVYKLFLAHCITYYKGQWYCYLCAQFRQQSVTMVKRHLQEAHSNIEISISDFLNIDMIVDIDCNQFFSDGIVIEVLLERYFCVYCQCKIHGSCNVTSHVTGKRHQGHRNATTIIKDIYNVTFGRNRLNAHDIYILLIAHCITCYEGQWYCYLCKLQQHDFLMAKHHLQNIHSDIKIRVSDFLHIDKILKTDCEHFFNHGIVIEALLERYFCVYCKCKIYGLGNIASHVTGKRHQGNINATTINATTIIKDKNVQESSDDDASSIKSDVSVDEGTLRDEGEGDEGKLTNDVNEWEAIIRRQKCETMYENQLLENKINVNDSTSNSNSWYNKTAKGYKLLIAQGVTRYNNQWYCYPCNIMFRNFDEAHNHSEQIHSKISEFPKNLTYLPKKKCKKFLNNGTVMLTPKKYFCIHCQCTIHDSMIKSHHKTETHKHYMWLIKNKVMGSLIEERLRNTSQDVQDIKGVKSMKQRLYDATSQAQDVKSVEPRLHEATSEAEDVEIEPRLHEATSQAEDVKSVELRLHEATSEAEDVEIEPRLHEATSEAEDVEIEPRLHEATSEADVEIEPRLHDATNQAEDVNSVEPKLHDATSQASTACVEHSNVSVDRDTSIEHIKSEDITSETKEVEAIDENEQTCTDMVLNPLVGVFTNCSQKKFTNIYKYFLMHRITRFHNRWYCDLCECTFERYIKEVEHHLSCENHSHIDKRMSDFLKRLADVSDIECRTLLNRGIVMRDIDNFFCVWCQCPMLSYYNIDVHLRGNEHKKSQKTSQLLQNYRKNIANNSDDTEKKKLSFTSEEDNENDDDALDTVLFCSLCDVFVASISTKRHLVSKFHVSFIKLFKQQADYIVEFQTGKEINRPMRLNIRNLDGTVCPKYCKTFTASLTCDKCDKIIDGNDLVNHEMTLHRDIVESFISSESSNQTFKFQIKVLVYTYSSRFKNYPMFKCSFCNEIIHGVLSLQNHFSQCKHKENMVKLAQIKKEEYNSSKNAQNYMQLFECLSVISLKNDNGTLQATEQPVLYVKIRRSSHTKPGCSIKKQLIYMCFICQCSFRYVEDIIMHFGNKQVHLHQLESTLNTYNLAYRDLPPSPKMNNTLECPKIEPPTDVSVNSKIKLKEPVNKPGTSSVRQADNRLQTKTNNDSKYQCESNESEERASDFFMSPDISADINVLIRSQNLDNTSSKLVRAPKEINISALDYYNQMYKRKFLEFEEIMFFSNNDALEKIKHSIKFYVPVAGQNLYLCLLCRVQHANNVHVFFEHIRCEEHVNSLKTLRHRTEELELQELMTYDSSTRTRCYACNMTLPTSMIMTHMLSLLHKIKRVQLLVQMEKLVEELKALWYSIQYFACVPCNFRYHRKIDFMEHLQQHVPMEYINNNSNFGFCITCATLWYDKKNPNMTYFYHREKEMHQYLENTNDFAIKPLPLTVQELLKNVDEIVAKLFEQAENALNDPRPIQLKTELEHAFQAYNLPVEICIFGSRVTGLALPHSDIDLYLNFGDENTDLEVIKSRSKRIQNCLLANSDNWEIELTLERSRTPLIKLRHRVIGLHCDLSFTNGLSVENSKLIRSFNTAYPPCHKLTLFLKKWMLLSGLSGSKAITNYALTWLVIFYLQVHYKIPSIADLIKSHNKSKIVGGWETGVGSQVPIRIPELPINELLLGFFRYYGEFDYMHCVVCPLLGEVCYKESFTEQVNLPKAMTPYVSQMSSAKAEYFRIDSSMCVQDPFDLAHNLTKAVPTLMLKRFKQYCNESVAILHYSITSLSSEKRVSLSSKNAKKMRPSETNNDL